MRTTSLHSHGFALAVAGLFMLLVSGCSDQSAFRPERVTVAPQNSIVRVPGKLQSASSLFVGCPFVQRMWEYTITFMAPEGKKVEAGEPILSFDARELMQRLQLLRAELDTRRKELEQMTIKEVENKENFQLQLAEGKVQTQKSRQKIEVPPELVQAAELRKQRLDFTLAQMNEALATDRISNHSAGMKIRLHTQEVLVKKLENDLAKLQQGIASLNVSSPRAGVVVYSLDWNGKKKAVGDRCWFGDNILELPDLSRMQVKAAVPEPQARRVKAGLAVEIRLDSNPDRLFKGRISSLSQVFRSKSYDQPAIVFDALVDISNSDVNLLRPGMAAVVDIIISARQQVMQVPEQALIYKEKGIYVWKKGFWGRSLQPVTLGERSAGMVEIVSGLSGEDEISIPQTGKESGR